MVVGLALTLAWTTLCLGGYLAGTMVWTAGAVGTLTVLGGIGWMAGRGPGPRTLHLAWLIPLPFLLYALASTVWVAPAPWLAWREWHLWFQAWLVFGLVLHCGLGRAQTWTLVGTLALLVLVGTGMAAYQRFVDPTWMMLGRTQAAQFVGRSAGMFGIPNSFAGLIGLLLPVCLVLLFSRVVRPAAKILCAWLALLLLFALVLTGSRGGWIALGLALLAWPFLGTGDWRRRVWGGLAGLVLAASAFGLLHRYSDEARQRLEPLLDGRLEASRPILWRAGWQMWQEAPWLGRGAASYNVLFEQYRPRGFHDEPRWAHNDHLNTLTDYGLVGFALWAGGGAVLLWRGGLAMRRARREGRGGDLLQHWRWRLGLLLGLMAFGLHLGVDFHTKIPALILAAAVISALLVRDDPAWRRPCRPVMAVAGLALLLGGVIFWSGTRAIPAYRAEDLRSEARRSIDRFARTGEGELRRLIPAAKADFIRAVRIDAANGQAWSDLAYATVQGWHAQGGDLVTLGRYAELAADEALDRCPLIAEFWVRKAVALDIQRGRPETESCYRRALELAPNFAGWWFYYAYHLQAFPNKKAEALAAAEKGLTLDRYYRGGEALQQQILRRR
ncbi:O-Antigen ligase [Lacunisphaera limnophila]|uniref:O-Antigen ligase n=1 Tax=Lacunisphaera limnophila TaxID=1838286 RepID=A0A1D8AWM3_9BACT|nr:O-antigen ligase family protein [Lacunisphaera limnophila]AOS45294.1 O-Antigen ligase [Lacunisphaera limnophila]